MSNKAGEPILWKIESIPRYSHSESPTVVEYLDHAPSKFDLDELREPHVTEYYEQPIKRLNTYTVIEYVSSSHEYNRKKSSSFSINTFIEDGSDDCRAKKYTVDTMSGIILRKFTDSGFHDIRRMVADFDEDEFTVLINGVGRYESRNLSVADEDNVCNTLDELTAEAIKLAIEKHEKYKIKKAEEELARDIERLDRQREKDIAMLTELQAKYGAGAGQ